MTPASRGGGGFGLALPREHGAWMMLYAPLVTGLLAFGVPPLPAGLLLLVASAVFFAQNALGLHLRRRGAPGNLLWLLVFGGVGMAAGAVLLLHLQLLRLAPLALPAVLLFVWQAWQRRRTRRQIDHSTTNEAATAAVMALGASAAALTVGQPLWVAAVAWGAFALYFVGSVLYVKMRVADARLRRGQDAGNRPGGWTSGLFHAACGLATVVWAWAGHPGELACLAAAPAIGTRHEPRHGIRRWRLRRRRTCSSWRRRVSAGRGWRRLCGDRLIDADVAVADIRRGECVFIGSGAAEPQALVAALARRGDHLADNQLIHIRSLGVAPYTESRFSERFRYSTFFIGDNVREAVGSGRADYTPIFLSEVPRLFTEGRAPIDTALIQVTPPDAHGYCSFGVSVDIVKAAAESATRLVAEVNPQMPRTLGDAFVHIDRMAAIVENDVPILELAPTPPDDVARRIGIHIADLVADGATIQMGIGTIPDSVLLQLKDHKDLGVHTEMVGDGIVDLIERGVVTGARKSLHRGKVVTSFALGTRRLYDFIDDNPMFEFYANDYSNDPVVIGPQRRYGGDQRGTRGRSDRAGVCRFARYVFLFRHRRTGRLHPWRCALERRQAHHRTALHCDAGRATGFAHRQHTEGRRRRRDIAWRCSLGGNRIRCR